MTQKRSEKSALATRWLRAGLVPLLLTSFVSPALHAEELSGDAGGATNDTSETKIYYENDTRMRGKDATGNRVGLSKFRNTLKVEHKRDLGNGWAFKGIFRGTYDGVYDINDKEYGKNAGGSINMSDTSGIHGLFDVPGATSNSVPYGYATQLVPAPGTGAPPGSVVIFPFTVNTGVVTPMVAYNPANNPNQGLMHLGQRWNTAYTSATGYGNGGGFGGLDLPVPVRPCNIDHRGCADFGGYGDLSSNELKAPEFNDRLDFIREFYAQKTWDLDDGKQFNIKVGKQQVVWGRSDLFRVLDVINPMDYSRNSIYDEFEDIRIPMWILQANYRMGASESLSERNIQLVWNFDKFRANNLGQCGTPNAVLEASCYFRSAKMLWDQGGTVGNLAPVGALVQMGALPPAIMIPFGGPLSPTAGVAATIPSGLSGIRNVELPDWKLKNTQIGARFEGVTSDGTIAFSLNGLIGRSQMPSLQSIRPSALAFDLVYPRISVLGGSMDFNAEAINTTVRLEGALSHGEEFTQTNVPSLYAKKKVWRSVVGLDRPTQIDWLNPGRTTLISAQFFWQHIFDFVETDNPSDVGGSNVTGGTVGWKDNHLVTLLVSSQYMQDRLNPQFVFARDIQARANMVQPSVTFLYSDKLKFKVGANYKWSTSTDERFAFHDGRGLKGTLSPVGSADPVPSLGIGGLEALGRFKAGLIGTALKEDEIFFNMQYQF